MEQLIIKDLKEKLKQYPELKPLIDSLIRNAMAFWYHDIKSDCCYPKGTLWNHLNINNKLSDLRIKCENGYYNETNSATNCCGGKCCGRGKAAREHIRTTQSLVGIPIDKRKVTID